MKHGLTQTRLYRIWGQMRARCYTKSSINFQYYGDRGITVCSEWDNFNDFYSWAINSGYEDSLSLDRIDVNGNYDNVNIIYKVTSDFLFISGRFRVVNHGTTNSTINITYPTGVMTVAGVGSFGHVHVNNNVNTSGLSIRPANDGMSCFIQSGAGNTTVSQLVPNGDYVIFEAMIPLR